MGFVASWKRFHDDSPTDSADICHGSRKPAVGKKSCASEAAAFTDESPVWRRRPVVGERARSLVNPSFLLRDWAGIVGARLDVRSHPGTGRSLTAPIGDASSPCPHRGVA